jgi:hypothetical protein
MSRRMVSAVFVALGLAVAIHTDWHFARPAHHRLSLGLSWHWLLAVPVFALAAAYVSRMWSTQPGRASVAILGAAVLAAGILEPLWEYALGGATFEWAFGAQRMIALMSFVEMGLVAYVATLAWLRRRKDLSAAG